MTTPVPRTENEQLLRILSIFHYIVGGLAGLIACIPIVHFVMGISLMTMGPTGRFGASFPMSLFGLLFTLIAGLIILAGWAFAVCMILAGRYLIRRTHFMFCLVMAGIACIFTPFGTVLGVFTIIVLMRPEVKTMFGVVTAPPPQTPA